MMDSGGTNTNGRAATPGKSGSVSRRDFLRVGGLGVVGLSVAEQAALASRRRRSSDRRSCILILMTGGPSQLETFDPRPQAPVEIRGPMKAISTAVPGVALSESLPRLAERADRFSLIRSLHHEAAPIHETGLQLLQTGRLSAGGVEHPAFGSVVAKALGPRGGVSPYVVLPRLSRKTGVHTRVGQSAGFLGAEFEPLTDSTDEAEDPGVARTGRNAAASVRNSMLGESAATKHAYGDTRFGRLCLQARQMVECGVRCVTVNLFDSLTDQVTWDCHGRGPDGPATVYDYRDALCPQFDRAVSALLDDLRHRGMLEDTLVVATGEMGRTPRINRHSGRDHWPAAWSALIAGGGVEGGRVIGATDSIASEPIDRPVHPGELTATIYHALGFDPTETLATHPGATAAAVEYDPVSELWS